MSKLQKANPGFEEALDTLRLQIFATMNCIQLGRIEKYTPGEQSAEIQIVMKATGNDGVLVEYPLLVDCPVFVLQGGGAYLEMPIAVGDNCIVLFNDRDIDNWWTSGNETEPNTKRKHDLSDGMALVGINPTSTPLDLDGSFVRLLGTSGAGAEEFAARLGDEVRVTIPANTFVVSVSGGSGAPAVGVLNPAPIDVDGTIITASGEVKIG